MGPGLMGPGLTGPGLMGPAQCHLGGRQHAARLPRL